MVAVLAAAPCCSFDCLKVVFPLDVDGDGYGYDDSHAHCGCGFGFGSGEVDLVLVPSPYLCYALFSAQPLSRSLAPLPVMS